MELIKKYFNNLPPEQYRQLEQLEEVYRYWNEQINVISRKDMDAFYERHVLHSLSIALINALDANTRVIDIGTGGGFPGIPLAILYPKTHFVLADSIGKKIKVVQEVIQAIGLTNAEVFNGRVEAWKGERFDLAVTRAVAPLSKLKNWSIQVLKRQNQGLICLKGGDLKQEIKASGLKTKSWSLHSYLPEPFFETKMLTWSDITL